MSGVSKRTRRDGSAKKIAPSAKKIAPSAKKIAPSAKKITPSTKKTTLQQSTLLAEVALTNAAGSNTYEPTQVTVREQNDVSGCSPNLGPLPESVLVASPKTGKRHAGEPFLLEPLERVDAETTCAVLDGDAKQSSPPCDVAQCDSVPPAPSGEIDGAADAAAEVKNANLETEKHSTCTPEVQADPAESTDNNGDSPIYLLRDLSPDTPLPWAFVVRVVAINPVREWKTWQSSGTLQEVYVSDLSCDCTRVTLFGDAIGRFRDAATASSTCYFAGGRIKRGFASKKEVEFSFGSDSVIHSAPSITTPSSLSAVRIDKLVTLSVAAAATATAVVHRVGAFKRIVTRKGKSTEKRDLLLVDDSNKSVVCTTWGQLARDIGSIAEGSIVAIKKNSRLSDYNNQRSASIGVGSAILFDPAIPRADELRGWYEELLDDHVFAPLLLT